MSAWQGPPPGERSLAPAAERVFERKVRLSRWALLFEQLWPRAWLVLGVAALFIGVSLAGLWPRLPELAHKSVLSIFALAFAAALVLLVRVRMPTREQAIRRMRIALSEMAVAGIKSNVPLHQTLMLDARFLEGGTSIHYLEHRLAERAKA